MKETISITEKEYAHLVANNQRLLGVYDFIEALDSENLEGQGCVISEDNPIIRMDPKEIILKLKGITKYPANKHATWLMATHDLRPRWISLLSFMGIRISKKS